MIPAVRPGARSTLRLVAAAAVVLIAAAPALAGDPAATPAPLWGSYWSQFLDYWTGAFRKQNGVVMLALGVGVISVIIITRGKWKK